MVFSCAKLSPVAKARSEKVPDTDAQREWMGSYHAFRLASAL